MSTARPLACRDGRPVPATVAPGRDPEKTLSVWPYAPETRWPIAITPASTPASNPVICPVGTEPSFPCASAWVGEAVGGPTPAGFTKSGPAFARCSGEPAIAAAASSARVPWRVASRWARSIARRVVSSPTSRYSLGFPVETIPRPSGRIPISVPAGALI